MRLRVILFFGWLLASLRSTASADTIHRNNGRTIVADRVPEHANR